MKSKKMIIMGVFALILAVGLNVRHAINDYGVKDSKLHIEAMACTSGACGDNCPGFEPTDPVDGGGPIVVTCGATQGQCWTDDGCETTYTPWGGWFKTTCCKFLGYMYTSCYPGMPC